MIEMGHTTDCDIAATNQCKLMSQFDGQTDAVNFKILQSLVWALENAMQFPW